MNNALTFKGEVGEITVNYKDKPITFLFDKEDKNTINQYTWCARASKNKKSFYAQGYCKVSKKLIQMHRLLLEAKNGEVVDHINHDSTDNRKENIRIVTSRQNALNRKNPVGASFDDQKGKWRSRIKVNGKDKHLGYFDTKKEAIQRRNEIRETVFNNPHKFVSPVSRPSKTGYKQVYKNKNGSTYSAQITVKGKRYYLGNFKTAREAAQAVDKFRAGWRGKQ